MMSIIHIDKKLKAFTIVELMVSITISIILLGGIFYFMSDTILGISRSSAQAKFLKDFYGFTTILDTGDLEILHNYSDEGFDVGILKSSDRKSGLIIGIVNADTLRLSPENMGNIYHNSVLGYRPLSSQEISAIELDSSIVYDYLFFPQNLFSTFNLRDFQMIDYNNGATVEMQLDIFPFFNENFLQQNWSLLPQDDIFTYSLVF